MCEGADAEHETRLLRIIDTIVACGDVSEADAKLIRDAIEDGLRARDLLHGNGAQFEIFAEQARDARPADAEVDSALITFYGVVQSAVMRRWANRWGDLGLKE